MAAYVKPGGQATLGGVIANAGPLIIDLTRPSTSTPQHKQATPELNMTGLQQKGNSRTRKQRYGLLMVINLSRYRPLKPTLALRRRPFTRAAAIGANLASTDVTEPVSLVRSLADAQPVSFEMMTIADHLFHSY